MVGNLISVYIMWSPPCLPPSPTLCFPRIRPKFRVTYRVLRHGKGWRGDNIHPGVHEAPWSQPCLRSSTTPAGYCCNPPHSQPQTPLTLPLLCHVHPSWVQRFSSLVLWQRVGCRAHWGCLGPVCPTLLLRPSHESQSCWKLAPCPVTEDSDLVWDTWTFQLHPGFPQYPLPLGVWLRKSRSHGPFSETNHV